MENLKYPIGKFQAPESYTESDISGWIRTIKVFPDKLVKLTNGLSEIVLDYRYRVDGWTIRQVVHHCADSHMNCIVRIKLALTEDNPEILPYHEDRWANLPDAESYDLNAPISILRGIHEKLGILMESLTEEQLVRTYYHPQMKRKVMLREAIATYAWHSEHHLAHIRQALNSEGKYN
ncbi:YfiT family bacillithiol transferase [Robertkochia solimangrovi]|uniref:YfiT family bacillithiol transferase n=1 Tax=Robertkochia solimangrovi TaxID=2213046 RepID=UPI00117CFF42|nr:putative metal-dependent hydrolase [Robertkochia solimangrovi]TRZ45898.1 putative metal-dependent hydrolase [Robertkochia solimangrovi]